MKLTYCSFHMEISFLCNDMNDIDNAILQSLMLPCFLRTYTYSACSQACLNNHLLVLISYFLNLCHIASLRKCVSRSLSISFSHFFSVPGPLHLPHPFSFFRLSHLLSLSLPCRLLLMEPAHPSGPVI